MGQRARWAVVAGTVVAVGALVLAACGAVASLTTARAIGNAFKGDLDQSSINVRFSLGLTPSQMIQFADRAGISGFTSRDAYEASQEALVFNWVSGHGEALSSGRAGTDTDNSFSLAAQMNDASSVELRLVNRTFYARVDIASLLGVLGHGTSEVTNLFDAALQREDATIPGISGLENGGWVSVPISAISEFEQQAEKLAGRAGGAGGGGVGGVGAPLANAQALLRALVAGVRKAFSSNATYANAGDHGGRTEYTVSLAVAPFVQQVLSSLGDALGGLGMAPAALEDRINQVVAKIPANRRLTLDVWVKDDRAQEIDIDLAQFDPKVGMAVPLRIVIGRGAPVAAPSAATPLDLSVLEKRLQAQVSNLPALSPGG